MVNFLFHYRRKMSIKSAKNVVYFVVLICSTRAGPPCPQRCVCDYYAAVHTINCASQEMDQFPNGIPEWTTSINFDGNLLSTLDLTVFNTTVYFEEFRIRYNEITYIAVNSDNTASNPGRRGACNRIANIFPRLTEANLRGNKLKMLPKCLLTTWPVLKILNLDENEFESLKDLNLADHIYHYGSLEEVFIKRNQIGEVRREDLYTPANALRKTKILDLSENRIVRLDGRVFMFLPELKDLRLKDNQIRSIPDCAFLTTGKKIETIQLNQNRIRHISRQAFVGLPRLTRLDLRDNNIECLTPRLLSTCQLSSLNLSAVIPTQTETESSVTQNSSNFLETVDLRSLRQLRIRGNRWRCDCNLNPFLENDRIRTIVYPSLSTHSCEYPLRLRNFYFTTVLRSKPNCGTPNL